MKNAKEVVVLRATNNSDLQKEINDYLKKGWHLTNTLAIDNEGMLYSTMYKE